MVAAEARGEPSDAGRSISDPATFPAPVPARGLHEYDNRFVPFRWQPDAATIASERRVHAPARAKHNLDERPRERQG